MLKTHFIQAFGQRNAVVRLQVEHKQSQSRKDVTDAKVSEQYTLNTKVQRCWETPSQPRPVLVVARMRQSKKTKKKELT
jgi:hypothetical protein